MSHKFPFFRALPAYLGGKRRLCGVIFALLAQVVERERWRGMTFIDPFMGGGSMSLYGKACGFRVLCNDVALRSAAIGRALIANSAVRLTQVDVAAVLREPSEVYPRLAEEEFYPRVFSREHAQVIDRALYWLHTGQIPEPRRSLLALLLTKWIL
ncbi:MAG: hypothetical protein AMJ38_00200 [Dehalococcoidia bacterium DG_22]|nr:MAG: hypothetical protein AMJ38_00200 [Dehalococcoidia bacterium DG_22]